jgi:ABC-type transporter Mla MlaB component
MTQAADLISAGSAAGHATGSVSAPDLRPPAASSAVRRDEHACCRLTHADDAERLSARFIHDGLQLGHRVICLSDDGPQPGSGDVEAHSATEFYLRDGRFEVDRTLASLADVLARALRDGYRGVSVSADMSWVLSGGSRWEDVIEYEQRLAAVGADGTLRMLCRYEPMRLTAGALRQVRAAHDVEVSPELAPIVRAADLAGTRVVRNGALRLAGELDCDCAGTLADVLSADLDRELRLDLADLRFVDVAGMRALRPKLGQLLVIAGASEPVRRLLSLMGWDTDPAIQVLENAGYSTAPSSS